MGKRHFPNLINFPVQKKEENFSLAGLVLAAAIDQAAEKCIKKGILGDFLLKPRAEVKQMILTEYNRELHIQNEKEIARREGFAEGFETGRKQGLEIYKLLKQGVPAQEVEEKLQITVEEVNRLID